MEKRRSRFDPEYDEDGVKLFDDFEDTDDEYKEPPRRSRFEDDDRPLFSGRKKKQVAFFNKENGEAFGESEEADIFEDDEHKSVPFLVRMFAWLAMLVVIFGIGYFAASYAADYFGKKSSPEVSDMVGSSSDVALEDKKEAKPTVSHSAKETLEIETSKYKLYIPNGKDFTVRKVEIAHGRTEQDIDKLLTMYFENLHEAGVINSDARFINLFKSDNLLYINTDSSFERLISSLDEKKATEVITGMLSTLWNNFSVKKVKFYIGGQEPSVKEPIDLSVQWGL